MCEVRGGNFFLFRFLCHTCWLVQFCLSVVFASHSNLLFSTYATFRNHCLVEFYNYSFSSSSYRIAYKEQMNLNFHNSGWPNISGCTSTAQYRMLLCYCHFWNGENPITTQIKDLFSAGSASSVKIISSAGNGITGKTFRIYRLCHLQELPKNTIMLKLH